MLCQEKRPYPWLLVWIGILTICGLALTSTALLTKAGAEERSVLTVHATNVLYTFTASRTPTALPFMFQLATQQHDSSSSVTPPPSSTPNSTIMGTPAAVTPTLTADQLAKTADASNGDVPRGARLYTNLGCGSCHGPLGNLPTGPKETIITDPAWLKTRTDTEIATFIYKGSKKPYMRGYRRVISPPQMDDLLAWMRSHEAAAK